MESAKAVAESMLTKVELITLLNFSAIHWSLSKTIA